MGDRRWGGRCVGGRCVGASVRRCVGAAGSRGARGKGGERSTLNAQRSTSNHQPSTIDHQPRTGSLHTRWLSCFLIDESKFGMSSSDLIRLLDAANIESRPVWKPMHTQPLYRRYECVGGVATDLNRRGICLPSSSSLSAEDQQFVIERIRQAHVSAKHRKGQYKELTEARKETQRGVDNIRFWSLRVFASFCGLRSSLCSLRLCGEFPLDDCHRPGLNHRDTEHAEKGNDRPCHGHFFGS